MLRIGLDIDGTIADFEGGYLKRFKKYYDCFLCERTYKKEILFFPECNIHSFCKECIS